MPAARLAFGQGGPGAVAGDHHGADAPDRLYSAGGFCGDDFTGGLTNASNAFASALWALDFLHWWAAHGARGIDFHNKRWISTDTILPSANGQWMVYPKAYGIKAFAGHRRTLKPPCAGGFQFLEPVRGAHPPILHLVGRRCAEVRP